MNTLFKEKVLTEEGLTTLMSGVASIINSRPLTKVSMTLDTRKLLRRITSFCRGLALLCHVGSFKGRICIHVGGGARYNTLLMFSDGNG